MTNYERTVEIHVEEYDKKNKFPKKMNRKEKEAKVIQHIVNQFMTNDLGFDKEDWEQMKVETIFVGKRKDKMDNKCQTIYFRLSDPREANKIRSRLGNSEVPKTTSDKVTGYVHEDAWEHYKAYSTLRFGMERLISFFLPKKKVTLPNGV